MKQKTFIYTLCLFLLFNTAAFAQAGKRLPLLPPSHEIKEAEDKIIALDQDIAAKQAAADLLQPKLDAAKKTWEDYHAPHANSPTDKQTMATCETYFQNYAALNKELSEAFDAIDALELQKKDQHELMEAKKQEFITEMIGKSLCNLTTFSTYDDMIGCWRCFFDGSCATQPNIVLVPSGTRAVPNRGAPPVITVIKKELTKDIYVPPPPASTPPQKGYIEEATDKVRGYFQELINKSKRLKDRVIAVAVRG